MRELTIGKNDGGQRLDRFLSKALPHLPPSLISRLIRKKHFRVNGKHVPPEHHLSPGDILAMYLTDEMLTPPPAEEEWRLVKPEVIIAYEDENVLVVDKESGVNSEAVYYTLSAERECYFIHRLDRNTEGLLIFAHNKASEAEL